MAVIMWNKMSIEWLLARVLDKKPPATKKQERSAKA